MTVTGILFGSKLQLRMSRTEKGKNPKHLSLGEQDQKLEPRKGLEFRSVPRTSMPISRHVDDVNDAGGADENSSGNGRKCPKNM